MSTHHLPVQISPFVGRATELATITAHLANPLCRLLTLVGPGGIGKTRLAIEAANMQVDTYLDGVYFVALQPLRSADFLTSAIAGALRFQFYADGEPQQQLLGYLREKTMLLVLDNFEHLLDGAELVSSILAEAPAVKIVTTSRERLNLSEEWVLTMHGLSYPSSETEVMAVEQYSAIQLFVQNAQRVQVGFTLDDAQQQAVVRICQMVGGMPLGLELASAWVRALSCDAIANELVRNLDILETPARNVPPRHRTMRAVLDQSWNRLSLMEQDVFKKLSVFRGGFTHEAAEQVAGASVVVLGGLVDKSFLRLMASGRYEIHELMRQYGEEHLNAALNTKTETQNRHCIYYASFLHRQQVRLRSPDQAVALDEIENELDNMRLSWEWAVEHDLSYEILQSMHSVLIFCHLRAHSFEGERLFDLAVRRFEHDDSAVLAYLLLARNFLAWFNGRPVKLEALPRAIRLAYMFWTEDAIALPFFILLLVREGLITNHVMESKQLEQVYYDFLERFSDHHQQWGRAYMLHCLGMNFERTGLLDQAEQYSRKSKALFLELGDRWASCWPDICLGQCLVQSKKFREGLQLWQAHQDISREVGQGDGVAYASLQKTEIARKQQDYRSAKYYVAQGVQSYLALGANVVNVGRLFFALVEICLSEDRHARAVELLSFIRQYTDKVYASETASAAEQKLALLAQRLPYDVYQRAKERGKTLHLRAILDQLLDELSGYSPPQNLLEDAEQAQTAVIIRGLPEPLTEREREVLRLLAAGYSNREIAQTLVLALGTVKWYISEIFSKLAVSSRTQAIARARELDLLS